MVNVVDMPELCSAFTPSLVDRDPVTVAIGTEGTAPVLARRIKSQIEMVLEPQLGALAVEAGQLRAEVVNRVPAVQRRGLWDWVFGGTPRQLNRQGKFELATHLIRRAIETGGAPTHRTLGSISLIAVGPLPADLLTLRAVNRLQEADIIFHSAALDPAIVELARRDAERVMIPGENTSFAGQDITTIDHMLRAAKSGKSVLLLEGPHPAQAHHRAKLRDAAAAAGTAVELVPNLAPSSPRQPAHDTPQNLYVNATHARHIPSRTAGDRFRNTAS